MNKSSNRHMNIFHYYSQNGSLPIENNLTRGLAIIFQEYPACLALFLELLHSREERISIPIPDESYTVDFQVEVGRFESFDKVIGVALTTEVNGEALSDTEYNDINITQNKLITDISISWNDTLIIIEAKRTNEDCSNQLREQVEKYKSLQREKNGDVSVEDKYVSITWTHIVELLMKYVRINDDHAERVVTDYIESIRFSYPTWFPISSLDKIPSSDETMIAERITKLKYECLPDSESNLINGRSIPLDWGYASECNMWYEKYYKNNNVVENGIIIGVWPSNTKSQYWSLRSKSDMSFFDLEQYNDILNGYSVSISPYIKISDTHGREIMDAPLKKNVTNEQAESINRQRKRENADNTFDRFIREISEMDICTNTEEFKKDFDNTIMHSGRNVINVVVSFSILLFIPYKSAQELDKNGQFSRTICSYLDVLRKRIENK